MVLEFFAPEDVIIKQGSFSDALYIMVEGPKGAAEVCKNRNVKPGCFTSLCVNTLAACVRYQ